MSDATRQFVLLVVMVVGAGGAIWQGILLWRERRARPSTRRYEVRMPELAPRPPGRSPLDGRPHVPQGTRWQ